MLGLSRSSYLCQVSMQRKCVNQQIEALFLLLHKLINRQQVASSFLQGAHVGNVVGDAFLPLKL